MWFERPAKELILQPQKDQANQKLVEVSSLLDDIMDATENDEDLMEFHKYQMLLNHLNIKING